MSDVGQRKAWWKRSYALIWTNASAAVLLEKIAPFLRVKSRQAAVMLEFQRRVRALARVRDARGRLSSLATRELNAREALYRQIKRMNARPARINPPRTRDPKVSSRAAVSVQYLAGFIDGEGAVMLARWKSPKYHNPSYRPRMSITNADRRILIDIQRRYGGILASESRARFGWSHIYQLIWTAGMVEPILKNIEPHLLIKHKQASILLEFIRHRNVTHQGRQGRNGRFFGRLSNDVMAHRRRLWLRLRVLNARGVSYRGKSKATSGRPSTSTKRV